MKQIKEKMSLYRVTRKEMNVLKGGEPGNCGCACHYADCGGSSSGDNSDANNFYGFWSIGSGCA